MKQIRQLVLVLVIIWMAIWFVGIVPWMTEYYKPENMADVTCMVLLSLFFGISPLGIWVWLGNYEPPVCDTCRCEMIFADNQWFCEYCYLTDYDSVHGWTNDLIYGDPEKEIDRGIELHNQLIFQEDYDNLDVNPFEDN